MATYKVRMSFEYHVDADELGRDLNEETGAPLTEAEVIAYERNCLRDSPKDYGYFLSDNPDDVEIEIVGAQSNAT